MSPEIDALPATITRPVLACGMPSVSQAASFYIPITKLLPNKTRREPVALLVDGVSLLVRFADTLCPAFNNRPHINSTVSPNKTIPGSVHETWRQACYTCLVHMMKVMFFCPLIAERHRYKHIRDHVDCCGIFLMSKYVPRLRRASSRGSLGREIPPRTDLLRPSRVYLRTLFGVSAIPSLGKLRCSTTGHHSRRKGRVYRFGHTSCIAPRY